MSVVIVGGHDRMVSEYKKICSSFNCKAKIFTQMTGSLKSQIGDPDLLILFTNTVSHKMIQSAAKEGLRKSINIAKSHSSSQAALKNILEEYCKC
jgi:hypothetical protein